MIFANILAIIIIIIALGFFRNWQVQHNSEQKLFLLGKVPNPKPNGFYKGSVSFQQNIWQGKTFDKIADTGINILKKHGKNITLFPFTTYVGKGLQDKNLDVLKIDYNNNKNPWWARIIVDEIVETKPHHYLGKAHVLLIPFFPFTLGYFQLEKNNKL